MKQVFAVVALFGIVAGTLEVRGAEPIYPVGKRFPLLLYSIHTVEEMKEVEGAGWNVAHRYSFDAAFFEVVEKADWLCVPHLNGRVEAEAPAKPRVQPADGKKGRGTAANAEEANATGQKKTARLRLRTEEEVRADIAAYAAHDCVAWWDFPEEQRWWRRDEYQVVKNLSAWTRKYDPAKRPNYMYLPGHYRADAVAKYVPYLDIIGAGTYTEYSHQPRAWVRWRTEETIRGIRLAGCRIGADYLAGEKVPIGIPMLFSGGLDKADPITPVGAYHDFWSCIASGAKGIFLFSFWHRRDLPLYAKTWEDGYNRAARNLYAVPGLDQAILYGEDVPLRVAVTKGSPRTPTFRPYGVDEDISLPSVNVLGKKHDGRLYIVAVSSRERPVTARVESLPEGIRTLRVYGETRKNADNTVPVVDGAFEETFPWLTVRLYSAELP